MTLLDADVQQRRGVLGEDTWDLFATIEESFGVSLPDYQLILDKSVGELAEYITSQSRYAKTDLCISSAVFYKLRRTFLEILNIPRSAIRPSMSLVTLLPWNDRGVNWIKLEKELGLTFPTLTYPLWLVGLSIGIAAMCSISLSVMMKALFGLGPGVILVVASFFLWIFALRLLLPFARVFPKGCATFGDLVKAILARNYGVLASRYGSTSHAEITLLLCRLIASETGTNQAEITKATRIPVDLNIE